MSALRIAFLLKRAYRETSLSVFPIVMRFLADAGVTVQTIAGKERPVDLSAIRPEYDLYVLKQIAGISLSMAGALHAQGATIVNPYPVTVAMYDKIIATRMLAAAGVPIPATSVVSKPELLVPLLANGPLVLKPANGTGGYGVRIARTEADLVSNRYDEGAVLAQRYHVPEGADEKVYVIGERVFGVKKTFPARTEAEKHGEPFVPTEEHREIALRCGRVFGIDVFGVDFIRSEGTRYVVDMSSIPGFKGVPNAPRLLADYFYTAAERAKHGEAVQV